MPRPMANGEWTTTRERKQLAKDQREAERQQIRNEKRQLRDLRYMAATQAIPADLAQQFWGDLATLQQMHGKEGHTEFWWGLVPRWEQFQLANGGATCPDDIKPANAPRITETHRQVAAALERAARHQLTVSADAVLQAWASEAGTV